jgi:hypothetical protein
MRPGLCRRCPGADYEREGEKIVVVEGSIHHEPVREHVPPDTRAAEFWLRNRQPNRWKYAKQLETKVAEDERSWCSCAASTAR